MPDEIGFFNSILCSSVITEPDKNLIRLAAETAVRAKTKIELSTIAKTFISDLKEVVS